MSDVKWCNWHKCEHPIEEFGNHAGEPDGKQRRCRAARSEHGKLPKERAKARRKYRRRVFSIQIEGARKRAKRRGVPCTITAEDLAALWAAQRGRCDVAGCPIELHAAGGCNAPTAAHLDCTDPALGYVKGNCVYLCAEHNRLKDRHTLASASELVMYLRRRKVEWEQHNKEREQHEINTTDQQATDSSSPRRARFDQPARSPRDARDSSTGSSDHGAA